jgi:CubicO group peptidase (beta-lactamase class C family)
VDEQRASEARRLRSALDALVRGGRTPGIQYRVVDGARTVFEYDGGWADIATRRPMDPETTMMAYSMSKPITAAAALQLVEANKVGLDDPTDRFLDLQPYGPDATVRQLLSHMSGIPSSRLFGDATRDLFYAEQRTRRGTAVGMTLGWHIGSTRGARFFYKEGGGGGFHSTMRLYPSAGIGTVVMTNATRFDVRGHLNAFDRCFLYARE